MKVDHYWYLTIISGYKVERKRSYWAHNLGNRFGLKIFICKSVFIVQILLCSGPRNFPRRKSIFPSRGKISAFLFFLLTWFFKLLLFWWTQLSKRMHNLLVLCWFYKSSWRKEESSQLEFSKNYFFKKVNTWSPYLSSLTTPKT